MCPWCSSVSGGVISDGCSAPPRHSPNSSKELSLFLTWCLSQVVLKSSCTALWKSPLVQFIGKLLITSQSCLFFRYSEPSVHMDDPFAVFPCHGESELKVLTVLQPRSSPGVFWLSRERLISIPSLSQNSLDWLSLASAADFKPGNIRLCWGEPSLFLFIILPRVLPSSSAVKILIVAAQIPEDLTQIPEPAIQGFQEPFQQ